MPKVTFWTFTFPNYLEQQVELPHGLSIIGLIPPLQDGLVNLKRYVYKGSLPTPPCYESVTWVVFAKTIQLQPAMVSSFHHINSCRTTYFSGEFSDFHENFSYFSIFIGQFIRLNSKVEDKQIPADQRRRLSTIEACERYAVYSNVGHP